jgi:hypothetical protein
MVHESRRISRRALSTSDGAIEEFAITSRHRAWGPRHARYAWTREAGRRSFLARGRSLYVVDFGVLLMDHDGAHAKEKTGVIWRITNSGAPTARRQ